MSVHVLLNLLKELGEKEEMRSFVEQLTSFPQQV